MAIPVGIENVLPSVRMLIEDADSVIPHPLRSVMARACEEIDALNVSIKRTEMEIEALGKAIPQVMQLMSIPGVGMIVATAFFAFVGDVAQAGRRNSWASSA